MSDNLSPEENRTTTSVPKANRRSKFLGFGLALVTVMGVLAYVSVQNQRSKLAANKPSDKAPPAVSLPVQLPDSVFIDQSEREVQLSEFEDQFWIADIIFTRCPGPCTRMTKKMVELQKLVPKEAPVRFISFTADPSHDTPEVLLRYAQKHGADTDRWSFLTGSKQDIYDFVIDGLRLAVADNKPENRTSIDDLFIHSTMFALVDRSGNIRGWYNESDEKMVVKLGQDLLALFKEKAPEKESSVVKEK